MEAGVPTAAQWVTNPSRFQCPVRFTGPGWPENCKLKIHCGSKLVMPQAEVSENLLWREYL